MPVQPRVTAGEDPPLPSSPHPSAAGGREPGCTCSLCSQVKAPHGSLCLGYAQSTNLHSLAPTSTHRCLVCATFAWAMSSQAGYALGILAVSPCLGNALPLRLRRIWTHFRGSVSVLAPLLKPSPITLPKEISLSFEHV